MMIATSSDVLSDMRVNVSEESAPDKVVWYKVGCAVTWPIILAIFIATFFLSFVFCDLRKGS